jgi:hypothetical protein
MGPGPRIPDPRSPIPDPGSRIMIDIFIPDEIVNRVVERMSALDDESIRSLMKRSGPFQPEITGFVLAFTLDLPDRARALATMGMMTAFEAFRDGYVKTRKARERLVRRRFDDARDVVAELAEQFRDPRHVTVDDLPSSEPAVMDALLDLIDSPDEPEAQSDEDQEAHWHLLTVQYTVVETLHECAGAPRFAVDDQEPPGDGDVQPEMRIGLAWYTPEQWRRMRDTAEDADDLDATYEEWLANAERTEKEIAAAGGHIERVMVDVDELLAWLDETGRRATSASRSVYALEVQRQQAARRQTAADGEQQ